VILKFSGGRFEWTISVHSSSSEGIAKALNY